MSEAAPGDTRQRLMDEFNTVVTETEQLLHSLAGEGSERAHKLRENLERNLKAAREKLADLEEAVTEKAKATAQATDAYVHEHPWRAIGIAAGLGFVVGVLLARR